MCTGCSTIHIQGVGVIRLGASGGLAADQYFSDNIHLTHAEPVEKVAVPLTVHIVPLEFAVRIDIFSAKHWDTASKIAIVVFERIIT